MPRIYLVIKDYAPNSAATNRFMGMVKTFSARSIEVDVVFFCKADKTSEPPALPYVRYHKFWRILNPSSLRIKNLLYVSLFKYLFFRMLKPEDIVYLYTCNEYVSGLVKKKYLHVFHERTEHPLVSKMKCLNVSKYLKATSKLDGLFVISHGLKDYFSSVGVPSEKIHIINMTVDTSRFEGVCKNDSEPYIAYCGKATNNKDGVNRLIEAFAIVSKKHPEIKLYIIGSPPKKSDESGNYELVNQLDLSNKVVFTGVVPSEKMPQMLKNATILALARPNNMQAQYGFPTKLGEYLLTGNPVVLTDVGDVAKFIQDKENALLASPESIEDFADKLNWVLDNPAESKAIGESGAYLARNCFNAEIETDKMIRHMNIKH